MTHRGALIKLNGPKQHRTDPRTQILGTHTLAQGTLERIGCAFGAFLLFSICFVGSTRRVCSSNGLDSAYPWAEDRSATFRHEYETEPRHWQKRSRAPKCPLLGRFHLGDFSLVGRVLRRRTASFPLNYRMKVKCHELGERVSAVWVCFGLNCI